MFRIVSQLTRSPLQPHIYQNHTTIICHVAYLYASSYNQSSCLLYFLHFCCICHILRNFIHDYRDLQIKIIERITSSETNEPQVPWHGTTTTKYGLGIRLCLTHKELLGLSPLVNNSFPNNSCITRSRAKMGGHRQFFSLANIFNDTTFQL